MVIIHTLIAVIQAVLRSAASSFMLLMSSLLTAVVVLAIVGYLGISLSGMIGLHLSRRRRRNKPPAP